VNGLDALFAPKLAVVVPEAVGRELAGAVRGRLERSGIARYELVDRGSYGVVPEVDEPVLLAALTRAASEVTGRALAVTEARALWLGAGDYLLAHHDRVPDEPVVELTLELSSASVPGAEVHYRRRGHVYFRFGSVPGALAIVERDPTVTCNHTYVSRRHAGAAVIRVVVRLRDL